MMLISSMAALLVASEAPAQVSYETLMEGRNADAVSQLESNAQLDGTDPAVLINLGVAYARQGREAEARAMFQAAMNSADRETLETAEGKWKDSRHLARLALLKLAAGEFRNDRMAAR